MEKSTYANSRWHDWKWQLLNAITRVEELVEHFPYLKEELENLIWVVKKYRLKVTPYYLSLADRNNPFDPVALQIIPRGVELLKKGDPDPYQEEKFSPLPHLIHRYPDRVLLLLTNLCPTYCRHCMRKRLWRTKGYVLRGALFDGALEYLRQHSEVRDVLITGGDPLILKDEELEYVLAKLKSISHVKILRLGSRVPVTLPMRLTDSLGKIFQKFAPVYINTHFNHPSELTDYAVEKIKDMTKYGVIWGNQTVLLKNINDSTEVLLELFYKLAEIGVRPYYLFQCDPVEGVSHFRIPLMKAFSIYRDLLTHSGMVVPKFALDLPEGGGKIVIAPDPLPERIEGGYILTSYDGKRIFYPDPDEESEEGYPSSHPTI